MKKHRYIAIVAGLLMATVFGNATPADDPPNAAELVTRAGKAVDEFLQDFSSVKCTEKVMQARLNEKGKAVSSKETAYDYLVMFDTQAGNVQFQESRLAMQESKHREKMPLLVTNGFSALLLIFYPEYQSSFSYELAGREGESGRALSKIHFRHLAGMRSPIGLLLKNREFPLRLEGDAWLDESSGVITRIQASLAESLEDIGVRQFRSEVRYSGVNFSGAAVAIWLPAAAQIELATARNQWRNQHTFSDYKLFSVRTETKVTPP